MRGRGRGAGELEEVVVRVAVEPVLPGFVGPDDGMRRGVGVGGGVASGRLVAAADVAALLAEAQVDPVLTAHRQAVLAAPRAGLRIGDLVDVGAGLGHGRPLFLTPFYPQAG